LLAVAGGLSAILVEMEKTGIVHFDLKPPQVMIDKATGAPLLCDFDFSVIAGKSKAHKVAMTPFYFATEHLKRDLAAFTQATNVFLMALVIFEMVTRGHKPHLAEDVEQYEQAIAGYKVRRLKELLPGAAPAIDELLYRALDPDPASVPPGPSSLPRSPPANWPGPPLPNDSSSAPPLPCPFPSGRTRWWAGMTCASSGTNASSVKNSSSGSSPDPRGG
jgi:serine/threonine protein kinase